MSKQYYVYILSNKKCGVLYIGSTNDIIRRVYEHKNKMANGFTKKYNLTQLVYYQAVESKESAIAREKQLKNWHRAWKIGLIEQNNPEWIDLYESLF